MNAVDQAVVMTARPKELHRIYLTTVDAVLDGRLPVSKEDSYELAALKILRENLNGIMYNMEKI